MGASASVCLGPGEHAASAGRVAKGGTSGIAFMHLIGLDVFCHVVTPPPGPGSSHRDRTSPGWRWKVGHCHARWPAQVEILEIQAPMASTVTKARKWRRAGAGSMPASAGNSCGFPLARRPVVATIPECSGAIGYDVGRVCLPPPLS